MRGAHQLALRGERQLAHARESRADPLGGEPGLQRGDLERALRRVAHHRDVALAFGELRVAREVRGREQASRLGALRAFGDRFAVDLHLACRRVARAGEGDAARGRDDHAHGHLVVGERARLVARDDRRRAQRLDRGQPAHDRVALRHALHAERQHDRGHGREALRHRGHGERDGVEQHADEDCRGDVLLHHQDRRAHDDRDRDHDRAEDAPETVELALQRRGLGRRGAQQRRDAAELGVHAGRGHQREPVAEDGNGPRVNHVDAVAERGGCRHRRVDLVHCGTLAGERGLAGLERDRDDHARIGGHRHPLLDDDEVAGHQVGRRNRAPLPVAHDDRHRGGHAREAGHGPCRTLFLEEAERGVEGDDREDRQRLVGRARPMLDPPDDQRHDRCRDQQQHERAVELREEPPPCRHRRRGGQYVATQCGKPLRGVAAVQAALVVGAQGCAHFRDRAGVRVGQLITRDHGGWPSAH